MPRKHARYPGIEAMTDGRKRIRLRAVDPRTGRMKEVGWFEPWAQRSGFSAYWMSKDIVYAIDLYRGIDILRYHAKK